MLVCVVMSCLIFVALWSPTGKGLTSWLWCVLCFVTFPGVSWFTLELGEGLALWGWFKPSCKIFYWPFQGGPSFVDLLCLFCLVFAMPLWTSVYMCLVVTCWERADLSALVCGVLCWFPIVILGQVWYLIVSIPDICTLLTLYTI